MAAVSHSPTLEDALGTAQVARILGVHPRTIERRRRSSHTNRPFFEQREEKLRQIWRNLTALFTPENALYWLRHPVPALDNRRPMDLMTEDGGLDRVLETIGRMSWGIPS
jgi:putative toxin-antitoxin system antitoxin component (TIGR02293 family)